MPAAGGNFWTILAFTTFKTLKDFAYEWHSKPFVTKIIMYFPHWPRLLLISDVCALANTLEDDSGNFFGIS